MESVVNKGNGTEENYAAGLASIADVLNGPCCAEEVADIQPGKGLLKIIIHRDTFNFN